VQLDMFVPYWDKFTKLIDMLELPLVEIEQNYAKGQYKDFGKTELVGLVKALFSDSPNRKKFVAKLS